MGYIDLHLHTTASDGVKSPSEIVNYAKRKGLRAIAITDHDTIEGCKTRLSIHSQVVWGGRDNARVGGAALKTLECGYLTLSTVLNSRV